MATAIRPDAAALIVFEKTYHIPEASPARLYEALTDAAQLRTWFAEHVRIEARVGGAFAFWGRHTPWTATEAEADQRITALEPGRRIAFSWTWRGVATRAELTVAADGVGARISVRHSAAGELTPPKRVTQWLLGDFWRLSVGNLREYARSGRPVVRPDYEDPRSGVHLTVEIDAPPAAVFAALSDPALMNQWIAKAARVEPRVGGAYSYGWGDLDGHSEVECGPRRLVEFVQDCRITHDWFHDDEPPTRVTWALQPLDGGRRTRVTLTHEHPSPEPVRGGYIGGWTGYLIGIKEFTEQRQADAYAIAPG